MAPECLCLRVQSNRNRALWETETENENRRAGGNRGCRGRRTSRPTAQKWGPPRPAVCCSPWHISCIRWSAAVLCCSEITPTYQQEYTVHSYCRVLLYLFIYFLALHLVHWRKAVGELKVFSCAGNMMCIIFLTTKDCLAKSLNLKDLCRF